jgi:hypothetical protein
MAEETPNPPKVEDFMTSKWRPAMGWTYMIICILDMGIFPIVWSLAQVLTKQPITQWDPLTLRGAGLFHMAMGAVLGIAAFGRTQEKVAGASVVTVPSNPSPSPVTPAPSSDASLAQPTSPPTPSVSVTPASVSPDPNTQPDPSDPPPMSSKMAERMARFKK